MKLQQAELRWLLGIIKCFFFFFLLYYVIITVTSFMHDAVCPPCTGRCPVFTKDVPLFSLASVGSWSQTVIQESVLHLLKVMKQQPRHL